MLWTGVHSGNHSSPSGCKTLEGCRRGGEVPEGESIGAHSSSGSSASGPPPDIGDGRTGPARLSGSPGYRRGTSSLGGDRGLAGRLRRGDVHPCEFPPPDKQRPVLILTRDSAIGQLTKVTVAPLTSTIRDVPSEVILDVDDGMKNRCAVNLYNAVTISQDDWVNASRA